MPAFGVDEYSNKSLGNKKKSGFAINNMMETFIEWCVDRDNLAYLVKIVESIPLNEADSSHYSIEVNYRTTKKQMLDAYAKLVLGYVSAAMKRNGYHVKHVYQDNPIRILVATRNWDDGEWIATVIYNPQQLAFVLSSGYWNKDRRTVSIHDPATKKLDVDDAAGIVNQLINYMYELKNKERRKVNTLKPAPMKRGPKP